jgi:hypothetical protein
VITDNWPYKLLLGELDRKMGNLQELTLVGKFGNFAVKK